MVIEGFRPPVYLTFCIYLVQRFYFYKKKSQEPEVLKSICGKHVLFFSVKVRTKNRKLRRTCFGYNNSEMLLVKCCIFLISGSIGYNQRNR